jgi:hypothetical protein
MKRVPALVSLSHDHHRALVVARALRRASAETVAEDRADFLAYWDPHGRAHFRLEEEILLPAYAGYGDSHHPLVARALCDHVAIRHLADGLGASTTPPPSILHDLGIGLFDHIRFEERELFPLIENALPALALAELGDALRQAEALLGAHEPLVQNRDEAGQPVAGGSAAEPAEPARRIRSRQRLQRLERDS